MPCTVLDPCAGAGTTGLVADRLGRDAVLVELQPEYAALARRRLSGDSPLFADVVGAGDAGACRGTAEVTGGLQPRPHKYHARRTEYAGACVRQPGEAGYARRLDLLKAARAIHAWRRGWEWVLLDAPPGGGRRDRITLRPDFEVWPEPGRLEVRDFKGVLTAVFRLKARLWRARYPDVPLIIVRADGSETPAVMHGAHRIPVGRASTSPALHAPAPASKRPAGQLRGVSCAP